jgi:hypothetical protein
MAVAGNKVIGGVSESSGDQAGSGGKTEETTHVVRRRQRCIGSNGDEFDRRPNRWGKPNHRVDRIELGVSRSEVEAVLSAEGGEAQGAFLLVAEDGLDGCVAETARVVVEENGVQGRVPGCQGAGRHLRYPFLVVGSDVHYEGPDSAYYN